MNNFGQTPVQLMTEPHPPRQSVMTIVSDSATAELSCKLLQSPMMFQPVTDDLCMVMKFISNSAVVHLSANTYQQLAQPSVVSISQNLVFALNRWNSHYYGNQQFAFFVPILFIGPQQSTALPPNEKSDKSSSSSTANDSSVPNLPLTVDPLLAAGILYN